MARKLPHNDRCRGEDRSPIGGNISLLLWTANRAKEDLELFEKTTGRECIGMGRFFSTVRNQIAERAARNEQG